MNIGLFGGTFDPPHIGHLILVEYACSEFNLETVFFIPNYISPFKSMLSQTNTPDLKEVHPLANAETRCEMVELAIVGNKKFKGEYSEVERKEVSYSIDTIRMISKKYSTDNLFLIMGADAFQDFPLWKEPDEIVKLATIAVAHRPGIKINLTTHPFGEYARIFTMPLIDLSSSDIRERISQGKSIQYLVPWTVQTFIEAKGLYR